MVAVVTVIAPLVAPVAANLLLVVAVVMATPPARTTVASVTMTAATATDRGALTAIAR